MREVTSKDGLGVGIVGLGVMYLVYPWASATMAGAEAFGMLSGMSGVSGLLTIFAGLAVLRSKD